jgi:hypothetical protein
LGVKEDILPDPRYLWGAVFHDLNHPVGRLKFEKIQ